MSEAANKLARLLTEQMKRHDARDTDGRSKLGMVIDESPLTIQPVGGRLKLGVDDLVWSNSARRARATLQEGDAVVLSLTGGVYTVMDVAGKQGVLVTTAAEVTQSGGMSGANVQAALDNADTRLDSLETTRGQFVGQVADFPGPKVRIPSRWFSCDGGAMNISDEPGLFNALVGPVMVATTADSGATFTVPGGHNLVSGDALYVDILGGLMVYVLVSSSTQFSAYLGRSMNVSTGAVTVNTIVTGLISNGSYNVRQAPHGMTSTTFNRPNYNGKTTMGAGSGTLSAGGVVGLQAGEGFHLLTASESGEPGGTFTSGQAFLTSPTTLRWMQPTTTALAAYGNNHIMGTPADTGGSYQDVAQIPGGAHNHNTTIPASSAATSHNNIQPTSVVHKIIYAGA